MQTKNADFAIATQGRGLYRIDRQVQQALVATRVQSGLCHVFIQHTSASLVITENADPDVHVDLETLFGGLFPDGDPRLIHTAEGPDDMVSHARSVVTATSLTLPIREGRLALGTWQGLYVWEHRHAPHRRRLAVTFQGE